MEPPRTISGRYNPHRLARLYGLQHSSDQVSSSFNELIIRRAGHFWQEKIDPGSPSWNFTGLEPALREEYGFDACSLAVLTGRKESCALELLESAWLWLSEVHDQLVGLRPSDHAETGAPEVWLKAAILVPEFVLERQRPELAIPFLRKTWNQAPLGANSPRICRSLSIALLEPFTPILGWSLRQDLGAPLSRLSNAVTTLLQEFPNLQVVRLQIDRGAQHVVVVQRQEWQADPLKTLGQKESWAARLLSDHRWAIIPQGETWFLYRPLSLSKSGNSA